MQLLKALKQYIDHETQTQFNCQRLMLQLMVTRDWYGQMLVSIYENTSNDKRLMYTEINEYIVNQKESWQQQKNRTNCESVIDIFNSNNLILLDEK